MNVNFVIVPRLCLCLFLTVVLLGCGGVKKDLDDISAGSSASLSSVMEYYLFGVRQIKEKDTSGAAATLGEMEIKYPLNLETGKLYAKLIEEYYEADQLDLVIETADRFSTMFPSHKYVANAHYFAGMVDYERGRKNISMDVRSSDPTHAKMALMRFDALLECCRNTEYAHSAKQYIYHLESMISLYELRYMEWDYDAGRIDAAAQRGISLMLTYPGSVAAKRARVMLSSGVFNEHRVEIEDVTAAKLPVEAEVVDVVEPIPEYVIYLASSRHPEVLKAKMVAMGLANDVDYYKKKEAENEYYFAAYGRFSSKDEAKPAQLALRVRTSDPDLWVRKLENSQQVANIDLETVSSSPVPDIVSADMSEATENVAAVPVAMIKNQAKTLSQTPQPDSKSNSVEKFYAIQVMSFPKLGQLEEAVESMGLTHDVAMFSHVLNDKTYYIALYGKYSGWSSGKSGLEELEQRTGKTGYWLREIDGRKLKTID